MLGQWLQELVVRVFGQLVNCVGWLYQLLGYWFGQQVGGMCLIWRNLGQRGHLSWWEASWVGSRVSWKFMES